MNPVLTTDPIRTATGALPPPRPSPQAGLLHASWQLQRDIAAVSRTPAGIAAGRAAGAAAIQLASPAEQPIHSVDLFAFCEVGACTNMPPGCREVVSAWA